MNSPIGRARLTKNAARAAAAAVLAVGVTFAVGTPAFASDGGTATGDVAEPATGSASSGCSYYHVYESTGGVIIGDGYECDARASETRAYRAWVQCSNGQKLTSPYVTRGHYTQAFCGSSQGHPSYGGYEFR